MTLAELLESWRGTYGLEPWEVAALGEAVSAYVEAGELAAVRDDPHVRRKVGARTMHEAARRFLEERLGVRASAIVYIPPKSANVDRPPPRAEKKKQWRVACGFCRGIGHNQRTCPELRRR